MIRSRRIIDTDLLFGQLCIEEGIAYEIDRMVAGGKSGTPAQDNSPPFPYLVLRELAQMIYITMIALMSRRLALAK